MCAKAKSTSGCCRKCFSFWVKAVKPKLYSAASTVTKVRNAYESAVEGNSDAAIRLPMTINKDKFAVGETAQLTIPSASGARALVSLEKGERVLKTFWVECKGEKTDISIPIEAGMAPNIYATVSLIQPYNNAENSSDLAADSIAFAFASRRMFSFFNFSFSS